MNLYYGAIRLPYDETDPPSVATEIDPLYVVQYMDRSVDRIASLQLANFFGPSAQLNGQIDNNYYFIWTPQHQTVMEACKEFSHNRHNCPRLPKKRHQKEAHNPRTRARST